MSRIEDVDASYFDKCTGITIEPFSGDDELFNVTFSTMSHGCGLVLNKAGIDMLIVGAEVREIHLDEEKDDEND